MTGQDARAASSWSTETWIATARLGAVRFSVADEVGWPLYFARYAEVLTQPR